MTTPAFARSSRFLLLVCALSAPAFAQEAAQPTAPAPDPPQTPTPAAPPAPAVTTTTARLPSETAPPSSPCLDDATARKGVQAKTFLKKGHIEIAPAGGLYASDLLSSSYAYGGSIAFYPFEDLGIEATFMVSPVALDVEESLEGFFGDSRFEEERGYLGLAAIVWSPIHFKVRTSGGGILHGDIELAVGGGKLWNDTAQGIAFQAGTRLELYLFRWLSLRIDVRDVMLIQEAVGETRFTNNIVALGGIGLWIPLGF
jgi:outer membrane beta-barrel protein